MGWEVISVGALVVATSCRPDDAERFAQPLSDACDRWEVDTAKRRGYFLAFASHCSRKFTRVDEQSELYLTTTSSCMKLFPHRFEKSEMCRQYLKNPEKLAGYLYAYKNGNGSIMSGDGWKFRTRGLLPLQGRSDYEGYQGRSGVPVVDDPDLLTDPLCAADSSGWLWWSRDCNRLADGDRIKPMMRASGLSNDDYDDMLMASAQALRAMRSA